MLLIRIFVGMRSLSLSWCLICVMGTMTCTVTAQYYYEVTDGIEELYQAVWMMDYDSAHQIALTVKEENPYNLLVHHIENYIDFIRIFVADDMNGLEDYRAAVGQRIDSIRLGPMTSPYHYFSQAEVYLQWSLVRSKKGEVIRAGMDVNRAFKLLEKCKVAYPEFRYSDKSLGLIHTMMGSIRGFRKTLIKLFTALGGDIDQGVDEIDRLYQWDSDHQSLWSDEVIVLHALLHGYINKDWSQAYALIQEMSDARKQTPLGIFLISEISYKAGLNEETIDRLRDITSSEHTFYYLDYLMGKALLNKQDKTAQHYFLKYLQNHSGQNFIKAAHHKLAWCELLFNHNIIKYEEWMHNSLTVGQTGTGADQEADQIARSGYRPNEFLLKARLLFDGGYYDRALAEVDHFNLLDASDHDKLEYYYRKGRVLQKLGDHDKALPYLGQAIHLGSQEDSYYACNAALQMAYIFYMKGDGQKAHNYAQKALKIRPKERKDDLHQESKVLIQRTRSM